MTTPKPARAPPPDLRQIPALVWLTDPMHRRWIVWRWVWNNRLGKWDKPPFQINGSHAASDDPETWVDYDTALAEVEAGRFDGVGLMLHGLPSEYLAAIDLDDVRDPLTGELLPWAQTLVTSSRSYCEVTPSGRGIRILGTAKGIDTLHRNGPHPGGGRFELFLNCKRYITVSGNAIGTSELADDTAQVMALQAMLGHAPRPATNGQTTQGIDRSLEFFRALRTLKGHGHSEVQVLAALEAVGKYGGRLGTELARAWSKLAPAPLREEPPADRWPEEPEPPPKPEAPPTLALHYGLEAQKAMAAQTIVRGVLYRRSVTLVYGAPKSGKSFLTTDLALSITARDQAWMGLPIVSPGPVLYVACEGHAGFWKRLQAAQIHRGWRPDAFPPDFVLATGRPALIALDAQLHIFAPRPADIMAAILDMKARGIFPVAVFVDTVFRSFGAGNVNASDHMNAYLAALAEIAELGCGVVAVHHEIKSGGTPAGSVSLVGGCDAVVHVWRDDGGGRFWQVEYAKDDAETEPQAFSLEVIDLGRDPEGFPASSCAVLADPGAKQPRTLQKLPDSAAMAVRALRNALAADGALLPPTADWPVNTVAVTVQVWREAYYTLKDGNQEAKQKAFRRAQDLLLARYVITQKDGLVWLVSREA